MGIIYEENSLLVFIFVTLILGGGAAWISGRSTAQMWRPWTVLFFSALLHHGTPPNMSAARRRALQFHYAGANCQHMTIEQHGQLFNEGGAYAGCRDWDLAANISRAVLTP